MRHFLRVREGAVLAVALCIALPAEAQNRQGGKKGGQFGAQSAGGGNCQKGQSQTTATGITGTGITGTVGVRTPNLIVPASGLNTPIRNTPVLNTPISSSPLTSTALQPLQTGNPFITRPQTGQTASQTYAAQLAQYVQWLQNLAIQQTDATLQQAIVDSTNPYVRTAAAQEIYRRQGTVTSGSSQ